MISLVHPKLIVDNIPKSDRYIASISDITEYFKIPFCLYENKYYYPYNKLMGPIIPGRR